jgi:hypothetical protein
MLFDFLSKICVKLERKGKIIREAEFFKVRFFIGAEE